jgi:hypothetical protein
MPAKLPKKQIQAREATRRSSGENHKTKSVTAKQQSLRSNKFAQDGGWVPFDPSSLSRDIPAKPWENIIMAKPSIKDEATAMKPRMSVMTGCPKTPESNCLK